MRKEEELPTTTFFAELGSELSKPHLVVVGRARDGELRAERFGQLPLDSNRGLVVDLLVAGPRPEGGLEFLFGKPVHPDEDTATLPFAALHRFTSGSEQPPARGGAEVTDTEVGPVRDRDRLA